MSKPVLVTGGCGFIGAAVVKMLRYRGEQVRVLDNLSRGTLHAVDLEYVTPVIGDIRDPEIVTAAAEGCSEVIHLAYVNGTETFYKQPDLVLDVGVKGIINVIEACRRNAITKLTLVSSSEVIRVAVPGEDDALVIPDPFNPRYSYSAGKIISEMMAIHCGQFTKLLICRPFNIYGPGMSKGHVVPDFIRKCVAIKNMVIKNDGYQAGPASFPILGNAYEVRSFCYISDFVDGLMAMRDKGYHNSIYNIGMPVETTIGVLAQTIAKLYGIKITTVESGELREGSIPRRRPNITKAQHELHYYPKVSLEDGLKLTIQSMGESVHAIS